MYSLDALAVEKEEVIITTIKDNMFQMTKTMINLKVIVDFLTLFFSEVLLP